MYHNKIHVTRSREQFADPRVSELPLSTVFYPENEIGLLDIWLVLVRRRKLLLAVFVASVLVISIPVFLAKPIYESRAVLEIGQVAVLGQLESRESLIQRIREQNRIGDSSEGSQQLPMLSAVGVDKQSAPDTLTLSAQGYSAEDAQAYLQELTASIIGQHQRIFENALNAHKKQLDSIRQQANAYQAQVDQLSLRINAVEKADPTQGVLLILEKARLIAQQPNLLQKRIVLGLSLTEPLSKPTQLLRNPTLPISKIKPRRARTVLFALVLASVLAVFSAFLFEFILKAREQLKARASDDRSIQQ